MKALSSTVVIHVSDLNRAGKYYIDVLGFKPDFEFGNYWGLSYDVVCIHLSGPKNQGMHKAPGSAHVCIDCDEIDTYYDSIVKKGAIINIPIDDRVYGMRDFAVNDEDGNTIVFGMAIV
ncbi:VOC family protein [Mucilaginibacter terrigena]|uniref:VOC family protein n=1 Tax=Mucilaginibacter terrigena TaxID=2492395 RepID=A0A4Q5LK97_9SPHI|nr:glyoxalase superfamily protein [Mucilaginibacter terrigena]RYU90081.1 VOC family protein [Mucilaginibacter terrigena]